MRAVQLCRLVVRDVALPLCPLLSWLLLMGGQKAADTLDGLTLPLQALLERRLCLGARAFPPFPAVLAGMGIHHELQPLPQFLLLAFQLLEGPAPLLGGVGGDLASIHSEQFAPDEIQLGTDQ